MTTQSEFYDACEQHDIDPEDVERTTRDAYAAGAGAGFTPLDDSQDCYYDLCSEALEMLVERNSPSRNGYYERLLRGSR